jgi:steroid delta-isomerase-like uncharacterized protein
VSGTQNTAAMVRLVDEVCNGGRLSAIAEIISVDCTHHDGSQRLPTRGPEGARQYLRLVRSAFPDLQVLIEDLVAEANRTVVRWSACGTHLGFTPGLPATGKWAQVTGITIARFTGGQISEDWTNWDNLGLLRQLRLVGAPRTTTRVHARRRSRRATAQGHRGQSEPDTP